MTTIIYLYEHGFRMWQDRLSGIYRFAHSLYWNVQAIEISDLKGDLSAAVDFWDASGCIIEGGLAHCPKIKPLTSRRCPIVWCSHEDKTMVDSGFVVWHNSAETAEVAVRELLKCQCRSYGYVGYYVKREWSQLREDVFRRLMGKAGSRGDVFDYSSRKGRRGIADFYAGLETWILGLVRPCGIFAANDEIGSHVLRAAANVGIAVPDEMVVIGVDNDRLLCENTMPALASVAPDFEGSGYLVAELLSKRMGNPALQPEIREFGTSNVVLRESIRPSRHRDPVVLKGVEFIRLHACEGIKVGDVATCMGVCRRTAEIRFARSFGRSIKEEIEEVRFRRACELIRRPNTAIDAVYYRCGYGNERSLREVFRRKTGLSISAWRKQNR